MAMFDVRAAVRGLQSSPVSTGPTVTYGPPPGLSELYGCPRKGTIYLGTKGPHYGRRGQTQHPGGVPCVSRPQYL